VKRPKDSVARLSARCLSHFYEFVREVVPQRSGKARPGLDLRHSFPEDKAPHLIAELLYLFRVGCVSEALRKSEKGFLFFLLRFKALLDQLDQHAVVAEAPFPSNTADLLGQPCGQGYAPSDLFASCHGTIIHHYGAFVAKARLSRSGL
jgi:hypothetical protein